LEYDAFVDLPAFNEGEVEISIRSLTLGRKKYRTTRVVAQVARTPESLGTGLADTLWLRDRQSGDLHSEPWYIRVKDQK